MDIGEKIILLKESIGAKNFQEHGKLIGVPGDWLNELSKKKEISAIDITRLIKIADYHNITLDWLLKDNNEWILNVNNNLNPDDIYIMLDNINVRLTETDARFNGQLMTFDSVKLANDSIEIIKKLIKQNL